MTRPNSIAEHAPFALLARLLVLVVALAALAGCLGSGGGPLEQALHLVSTDPDTGFLGVSLAETTGSIEAEFLFAPGALERARHYHCDAQVDDPIRHGSSFRADDPGVEIRYAGDNVVISRTHERMQPLTWFESFEVACEAWFEGRVRPGTEPARFSWSEPPRVGDPRHAFGAGPFFEDQPFVEERACNVQTHPLGGDPALETVCFPPMQIREVAIWQNETALMLRVMTEAEPPEAADAVWYHPMTPEGIRVPQDRYQYAFGAAALVERNDTGLEAARSGTNLTLTIPMHLLEVRRYEDYIPFTLHLRGVEDGNHYLNGITPPPYLLR